MKITILSLAAIFLASPTFAHSGRTDSQGGHNCSQASKDKGLCSGYHYHNNGSLYRDLTDELVTFADSSKPVDHHDDDEGHSHESDGHAHDESEEHSHDNKRLETTSEKGSREPS